MRSPFAFGSVEFAMRALDENAGAAGDSNVVHLLMNMRRFDGCPADTVAQESYLPPIVVKPPRFLRKFKTKRTPFLHFAMEVSSFSLVGALVGMICNRKAV
jgi:hypothetical protein